MEVFEPQEITRNALPLVLEASRLVERRNPDSPPEEDDHDE